MLYSTLVWISIVVCAYNNNNIINNNNNNNIIVFRGVYATTPSPTFSNRNTNANTNAHAHTNAYINKSINKAIQTNPVPHQQGVGPTPTTLMDLILVDCNTGSDLLVLHNDTFLDLSVYRKDTDSSSSSSNTTGSSSSSSETTTVSSFPPQLTIRAVLFQPNDPSKKKKNVPFNPNSTLVLEWDMDSGTVHRMDTTLALAGGQWTQADTLYPSTRKANVQTSNNNNNNKNKFQYFASHTLIQPGQHTLRVTIHSTNDSTMALLQQQQQQKRHLQATDWNQNSYFFHFTTIEKEQDQDQYLPTLLPSSSTSSSSSSHQPEEVLEDSIDSSNTEEISVAATRTRMSSIIPTAHGTVTIDPFKEDMSLVTISFLGPMASEQGMTEPGLYRTPSPFADYLVEVLFTTSILQKNTNSTATATTATATATTTITPTFSQVGYYAGSTTVAQNHGRSGSVWMVHFIPPIHTSGLYQYQVTFRQGTNVAVSGGGGNDGGFMNNVIGEFFIPEHNNNSSSFPTTSIQPTRYQLGITTNILDYAGFDNTISQHQYLAHGIGSNNNTSNPDTMIWDGARNIFGLLQYIQSTNVITTILANPFDTTDDDEMSNPKRSVTPYIDVTNSRFHYDLSKLAQWQLVLNAAVMDLGLKVQMPLYNATDENEDDPWTYEEQELLYREIKARFGHLVFLDWDEEDKTDTLTVMVMNDIDDDNDDNTLNNAISTKSAKKTLVRQICTHWLDHPTRTAWLNTNPIEDFTTLDTVWVILEQLKLFLIQYVPVSNMSRMITNTTTTTTTTAVWLNDAAIMIYLSDSTPTPTSISIPELLKNYTYSIQWYNVMDGNYSTKNTEIGLQMGSTTILVAESNDNHTTISFGLPPPSSSNIRSTSSTTEWIVLLQCMNCQ